MELQNNNLTLTPASAWRMALSLTLTDVCRVARQVYEVCKVILAAVLYVGILWVCKARILRESLEYLGITKRKG